MAGDAEYWSWGVRKFTPEEQAAYDKQFETVNKQAAAQQNYQPAGDAGQPAEVGYYSGYMGEEAGPVQDVQPAAAPQPSTRYLADPANFAEVWSRYDQDPDYQDEHYTREQIDGLYDYYSYRNQGKPMDQWERLMDDDPYVVGEMDRNQWWEPRDSGQNGDRPVEGSVPQASQVLSEKWSEWTEEKPVGDWNDLDWIGKLSTAVTISDQNLANTPEWVNKTQAAAQALSSAMAGPALLKIIAGGAAAVGAGGVAAAIANPWVLAGAAVAVGGLRFYQAVTGKDVPVFNKFLEISDLADTVTEHAIGFGSQAVNIARGKFQQAAADPNDAYGFMAAVNDTLRQVGQDASGRWRAGEYTYEMYGSVGDFAIDVLKEVFKGEEGTKEGEGWFFNRGINEKQQLAEGTYGQEGMENIRAMFEEMDKLGIDKNVQEQIMQQAVINVSGTSGNVSDYVAQMLIDLDILTTPLQNESAGIVSRIVGDERGVEATQINRGNMATEIPFIGNIVQAVQNSRGEGAGKAPGGIMEWMDIRRNLARSADVDTLSSADKFFGGIGKDGTITEYARTDRTGLADMLPESKVAGVGNIANNTLNSYMADVQDTADIRNRLARMSGELNEQSMDNSADVRTVRDGLKHAIAETNPEQYLRAFDESAGARQTLADTAAALGMDVRDVLSMYAESPAAFEQRVRDYAAKNNGMIAGIDVSQSTDSLNTIIQGFTKAKDGKGTPLAWDIRQVKYQITTSMIDSMAAYYTDYYGVKPNSTINTIFDTMKSAQSLLLLGWSPSYFLNNVINNAVTSAAEGVLGFMTPTQIRTWMDAFGVQPARFGVDSNAEFRGQGTVPDGTVPSGGLDAFTNAASQAKRNDSGIGKVLSDVNGLLRKANNKLGVFSNMSGIMEQLQGNQLTAVAIQQYWGQRWKRGTGFHLMPTELVDMIEKQNPGMTNVIYQAVENGLNMEQVGKALYGTYMRAEPGVVMKEVCDRLFRGEAMVYEEIFEKSGVMRDLNEKIRNCKTAEERAAVIESAKEKVNAYVENLRRENLIQRANNVAVEVESRGLAPVAQIMSEMEMNHTEFWIRQRQAWTDAYTRIMNEAMDGPARKALLEDLVKKQDREWADLYKQEAATAAGVMKGLGFQHESNVKYIGLMNEKNLNWQTFNEAKSRELRRAYERTAALRDAARNGKVDKIQLNQIWDDFHRNTAELYDQHFAREQELQIRMDAAFVEGYEFSTGKSGEQLRQNFNRINQIRQEMHDMQKDAHEKTSKMNAEDKAKFYEEFNPEYNRKIREIGNLGDANARIVEEAGASETYENHAPVNMTPEETVTATHVQDVNNAAREQAMRERSGYLDREGIRNGWIESGRTPAEADLMMAVYDALAETWAKANGMYVDEFYSQAARLKEIAQWLPGTGEQGAGLSVKDAAGVLHQVDTIRPSDVDTDNFRTWFGNSVMVDEDGKPKVFYHGSGNPNISEFDTEAGTYFTEDRKYAERYEKGKRDMGYGDGRVYECYLKIEKPFDTRDPECRRIFEEEYVGKWGSGNITERGMIDWTAGYDLPEFLREKGYDYDGLVLDEGSDGGYGEPVKWRGVSYVVLDPTQIKSIYNGGEWSGTDPNILHQTVGEYAAKYHDVIMRHYGTPEFRAWFGNSKVVDEYGLPLVVHHGTNAQFEVFSKEKLGTNTIAESAKQGFFFTDNEYVAESYVQSAEDKMIQYIFQTALDTEKQNRGRVYTETERAQLLRQYAELYEYTEEQWEPDRYSISLSNIRYRMDQDYFGKYGSYLLDPEDYIRQPNIGAEYIEASIAGLQNLLNHTDDLYDGQIMDTYLMIRNPMTYNFQGAYWNDTEYVRIIEQAKAEGHDGVIFQNVVDQTGKHGDLFASQAPTSTVYCVFEPEQIKSIENDGTFNKLDPNILHQDAQALVKGTFEHTDVGNVIRMLNASDVSTMVHESGHLFRRTLSQPLLTEFTTWAGFDSVEEFQELEVRFWKNDPTLSEADRSRYEVAEEKFARGFEQYLMDGSAPTPGLKAVFKAFRDYLLDIYQKVKATVAGNDYSGQEEFIVHTPNGDEVININAEIHGVRLRDIFDRMLTDDVQRMPGYQTLIQEARTRLSQDRHNMRMKPESLTRRAQVEVTKTILSNFASFEEAERAVDLYLEPLEIAGMRVDDATLTEAIKAAKSDPQLNPWADAGRHEVKGTQAYAYSINNANSGLKYQMQYKVVELSDLVPSNLWFGDQLILNEDYPGDVQARNRSADQSDVYAHAANLNPGLLLDEMHSIDSGTPIVGEGNMFVESGNGRVLSLLYAQEHFPEQWEKYQEYLQNAAGDYGIDPEQLSTFENPVLVRERLGGDAVSFAEDANSSRNKAMTASENALTDANKVNMATLGLLDIQPGEGIDTFTTEKNAQASVEWLRSLPEADRSKYSMQNRNGDLVLSMEGQARFTNALFATLYATPESMDIIRSFSETADSDIQALESALKQTLPEMARAEGLIRSGSRAESLSITGDVMAAAGLLQEARKAGINIHDYLAQQTIPGMERWTPTQALLAGFFGDAKNNVRMLRDFFNAYGEEVYKAGDPNQLSLFGDSKTREQMINDSLDAAINKTFGKDGRDRPVGVSVPQASEGSVPVSGPALNQSVMDSEGRWSSEFAKTLNENLQRTFDDGMSVPLDQAESVYLTGETNVKYETMVQRWLRDFSNQKNLSAEQYLYAWTYFEWWVQGSEGEAPKGNPIWEADVQKMVMQDFGKDHGEQVSELQRRYRKGAEVDPTAVPKSGEYFKRTYGFTHGFWHVAGNIYKDGKLVAYLPEELSQMKRSMEIDGQTYRILGVDLNDPEGLVYYDPVLEITRTVVAGKPEGFEEPRNPFAFIKPVREDGVPQTMPVADAYSELNTKYIQPALDAFGEAYEQADLDAQTRQMSGLNLQTRAQINQWLDQDVAEDMRAEKYRAIKYSDMKKDAAMLNYNQRYGFDPILTILSPYQFWYTRSMWKWAKRMIDKPALANAYERLEEYEDRNRQENLPSRLSGKWRIPMPFLPDWMGGSYYIDLNSQLFPWTQFGQSYSSNMNQYTLNARTEEILSQQVQDGTISAAEMSAAKENRSGSVWENAYAQAEVEIGRQDGLSTLASQFISPNIFISWARSKQKGEDPGTLSGTRTGNALKTLTSDIPLVGELGAIVGDAMTIPEKALRKLYGFDYNEFGQYGDQQIRKQISQMCADGEITWRQALNSMVEKSGTIWDMAADRQRKEAMYKVPGFAGAQAVKELANGNANLGQTIGTMAISALGGGSIYPEGEQTLRQQKAARDQAYIDQANGDTEAVSRWYNENPEYMTRSATYMDDPEELLRYTLYENISNTYYAQPYAQQWEIREELGPEFNNALINKETRNWKAVPIEKLAEWNGRLGNINPFVGSIDVQGVERVMQLSDPVINAVAEHDQIKEQRWPGISVVQDLYYSLPKDQRKAFLQQFPKLSEYWDWNRQYKEDHPEYVQWSNDRTDYFNEELCYNSFGDMSEYTLRQLEHARKTGADMSEPSLYELQRLYQKYADPSYTSYDEYVKLLMAYD